ncbi:hypothetical protein GBAR_LOCUS26477, partial [Geodia barretti]
MRYLSSLSKKQQHQQQHGEGLGSTPLATGGRQGDTVHSKTTFERWKLNQQDRLEKQKLIEEVVSLSSSGYAKELKETLENLRRDVKEALSSEITSSNNRAPEVAQLKEAELTQDLLQQLVRGQSEIREHLIHLRALCNQQSAEVVALKVQVSTLGEQQAKTIGSTLPTELAKLVETAVRQCLFGLEARVSQLSGQLKTHVTTTQSRSTAAAVREEDRGMGPSPQARHQQCHNRSTTTTDACVPTLHTAPVTKSSENSGTGQPNSQIQRKRKGPRDYNQQPSSTKNNSSKSRGGEQEKLLSQNSTESNSTPCDIDLTQHSPLACSQVISDSIQRLKQTSASSQPASQERKVPKIRPGLPSSPSQAPAAKRKRQTGRVTKQRATAQKGKVLATPKVTRRSQRLSNISAGQSTGKPSQPRHNKKECGAKIKTEE